MSTNVLVALVLFAAAQVCAALGGYLQWIMLAEVNRKLPDAEQISYFLWYRGKYVRLLKEYRRLYPGGRLPTLSRVAFATGVLLFLTAAGAFGFFRVFGIGPR
jgi:hypothetical protein